MQVPPIGKPIIHFECLRFRPPGFGSSRKSRPESKKPIFNRAPTLRTKKVASAPLAYCRKASPANAIRPRPSNGGARWREAILEERQITGRYGNRTAGILPTRFGKSIPTDECKPDASPTPPHNRKCTDVYTFFLTPFFVGRARLTKETCPPAAERFRKLNHFSPTISALPNAASSGEFHLKTRLAVYVRFGIYRRG